eukprot:m.70336 g.70336  ORF g.70336 m.70336 type:complete len:125 (+) comp50130_c0_seq2:662-1036(+)
MFSRFEATLLRSLLWRASLRDGWPRQMALAATPDEAKKSDKHPEFVSLLQGVEGTFNLMNQVFARNGLESFNPVGLKFDANKHEALVQVPDPSKESGTIAFVQKSGYLLKGRVLRAACVGVVKN